MDISLSHAFSTALGSSSPNGVTTGPVFVSMPALSPSDGPVGTEFIVAEGVAEPEASLSGVLTLDGVDVTGALVPEAGGGFRYASTAPGALIWTVTATNLSGSTAMAVLGAVNAVLPAPSFLVQPTISPSDGPVGTEFIVTEGVAEPEASLSGVLTLDGVDVTGDLVPEAGGGFRYVSTAPGSLSWTVTASNATDDVVALPVQATVDAVLPEPSFTVQPTINPAGGPVGTEFIVTEGVAEPEATLSVQLTLDGVDVTGALVPEAGGGLRYVSTAPGLLVWTVAATNASGSTVAPPLLASVSAAAQLPVASGSATFTVENATQVGVDPTGRAWVVAPAQQTLISDIEPAQSLVSGQVVGGVQVNPERTIGGVAPQGYDQRVENPAVPVDSQNYDPALNQTGPLTVAAGDVIVKAIPNPAPYSYGSPLASEWATLHVLSQPLPANAVLSSSVKWAGHSEPEFYTVDINAVMSRLPNRNAAGITFPPFTVLMESLGKAAPVFAQNAATFRGSGYETLMPANFKGFDTSGNVIQYGRDIGDMIDVAAVALSYNAYTPAQKEQIAWALVRHGIEWVFPIIGSGVRVPADGGHQQFWQFPGLLALIATGREDEIPTFMVATGGGNWDQFFRITDALIASEFSPHSDPTKPPMWRLRTLGAQPGGNVLRIPLGEGDQPQVHIPQGSRVMRGGTHVATLTNGGELDRNGTLDLTIDAQPVPPLAQGDVIYIDAPAQSTIYDGAYDWVQRPAYGPSGLTGGANYFSPDKDNQYRDLQSNVGQMMTLRALGYMHPSLEAPWEHLKLTAGLPYPTADNDYAAAIGRFQALDGTNYNTVSEARAVDQAAFDAMPQIYGGPIALSSITAPGTVNPGPLVDGVVIGLTRDATARPVEIRGTATEGQTVEVRILRQSDGSPVVDWTSLGTVTGGAFAGALSVPKSDGWLSVETRYAGAPGTVFADSTRWAVGWRVMLLGQSQISILTKAEGAGYTLDPANTGTASYLAAQPYNAGGASPEAEQLYVLDAADDASDGVRAFVGQFRQFDPNTPFQVVRESVNGTSILAFTDDQDPARAWSDLLVKTDRYGGDISVVVPNWATANASPLEGAEGLDILMGLNTHGTGADNALTDVLQPGFLYAPMPSTRHTNNHSPVDYTAQEITRANQLGFAVGPVMPDYEIEDLGGPHPLNTGQGNVRLGARMAVTAARALGLDASQNPYFTDLAVRSADGTQIVITPVAVNGGTFTSPQPNDLRLFAVSENDGASFTTSGFSAALVGQDIVLTRDSGVWAPAWNLQVRPYANGNLNDPFDRVTEQTIVAGQVYETWAPDILGLGLPLGGTLVAGQWSLQQATITAITQATAGGSGGGTPDVTLVSEAVQLDASASTSNRARWNRDAFGAGVADGDTFLMGAFQVSDWSGSTDYDRFNVRDAANQNTGTTLDWPGLEGVGQNSGGVINSIYVTSHVATASSLDYLAYTNSRDAMSYLPVYKLGSAVMLSGAVTGSGVDTVNLTGVPTGSTIVAFAQNTNGSTITWSGVTEDGSHSGVFNGVARLQAVASGTGGGSVTISAIGANQLVVVALPPV